MIKSVDFPNREFSSKAELFKALIENKSELINLKRSEKHSIGVSFTTLEKSDTTKSLSMDDGFIYPVINTTKYMDSHKDVHIDGIWNRSVKNQQGKIYYVTDHELKLSSVIAFPRDVEMLLEQMTWKELGANYNGNTQALIFKISKSSIQIKNVIDAIEAKYPLENSVRMQYVTLFLCINDENYKEELANWETYFPYVINSKDAEDSGYFWAVTEAKIHREGSLVLAGSNDITPVLQKDIVELVDKNTSTEMDSSNDTPTRNKAIYLL